MKTETFHKHMLKLHKCLAVEPDKERLNEYWEYLKGIEDSHFVLICDHFKIEFKPTAFKRFPIIGDFLDARRIVKPISLPIMEDVKDEDCASVEEIGLYMKIIREIHGLIKLRLSEYKKPAYPSSWKDEVDGKLHRMTYDEWAKRGFPPGWSDIYNHFAKGSYEALKREESGSEGEYLKFLKNYYEKLKVKKEQRIKEIDGEDNRVV